MPIHFEHDESLLAASVVDPIALEAAAAHAARRRRRQRLAAVAVAFLTFTAVAALVAQVGFSDTAPSGGPAPTVAVRAEAVGVVVIRPGEAPQRIAASRPVAGGAAKDAQASAAAFDLDGIARVEHVATSASVDPGKKAADSVAGAERIVLLDGRLQLDAATLTATSSSEGGRADGGLALDPATTLTVDGKPREARANLQVAVEGIGTVIVNEQAVVATAPRGDAQTGPRHRVVGAIAHVRITTATADLPAGTEVIVGRVDAGVREGKVTRVEHPPASANPALVAPAPTGVTSIQPGTPAPGETALPRQSTSVRSSAPAGSVGAELGSYLFPILGQSSYTNDWGGARASTGIPHQGTDIFAAEGTPIVAVADGVLDRVGWNAIGGYRFWLFDDQGNSFYHAHLSAYSPLAQDGARVKRGDVIGFVGHTGDAQGTPPHLHFEIHPGNGAATNPFPFLNGWRTGTAVAIGLTTIGGESRVAPLALLGFADISANSGLAGSVLETVPDTKPRTIEQETEPVDTATSLAGAIDGPAISGQ